MNHSVLDLLTALPDIRPPCYPPKMARYRSTFLFDIQKKQAANRVSRYPAGGMSLVIRRAVLLFAASLTVRLDIHPKWPVIESLNALISEQRLTGVPRYPPDD